MSQENADQVSELPVLPLPQNLMYKLKSGEPFCLLDAVSQTNFKGSEAPEKEGEKKEND